MFRLLALVFVGMVGIVALACGGSEPASDCADIFVPGVRTFAPGIVLTVRSGQGDAAAAGTTAAVIRTDVSNPASTWTAARGDSLSIRISALPGTYDVHVTRPFYGDTTLSAVKVLAGACGDPVTTSRSVTLRTVTSAPPVRSVFIYGTTFLATPGSQAHLTATVDADAGVSRGVSWQLTDTTIARIDQSGLVTSKCSVRGAVDTVYAASAANPSVRGAEFFAVGANGTC